MTQLECSGLKMMQGSWSCDYTATFNPGRWHVMCGTSGSGKSTLLHLLTGLVTPSAGEIKMGSKTISSMPPHQRKISFMSQSNSLFPGITILENLVLALHDSPLTPLEKLKLTREMTDKLNLEQAILERLPSQLSGGQLSRCNLARTLLRPCSWLFLDEPFSAVDRSTRLSILKWLQDWQKMTGAGIILVSHDLDDIFTVATDVHVIEGGRILESSTLVDSVSHPRHIATARMLRAGLVTKSPSGPRFVSSQHLYTHLNSSIPKIPELNAVDVQHAQVTRLGSTMRIIDFESAYDVVVPWDAKFNGTLWFDPQNSTPLMGGDAK